MSGGSPLSDILDLHDKVVALLREQGDGDGVLVAADIFHKYATIAAASRLEEETKQLLRDMPEEIPAGAPMKFIERKDISHGFHKLFAWERSNANKFFSQFDDDSGKFSTFMGKKGEEDTDFKEEAICFVHLGRERNRIVHNDLAEAKVEWTGRDIMDRFERGRKFLSNFRTYALEFARRETGGDSPAP